LDWITKKDNSAENSETELCMSNHVVAAANHTSGFIAVPGYQQITKGGIKRKQNFLNTDSENNKI